MKRHNQIIISVCYFFCALNCIIAWFFTFVPNSGADKSIIILGMIMLVMIPVAIIDPRVQHMQTKTAFLLSISLHILLNLLVLIMFSLWWLIPVLVVELLILFLVHYFACK